MDLAAPQGFEPRYADPESAVLPLNEGATIQIIHQVTLAVKFRRIFISTLGFADHSITAHRTTFRTRARRSRINSASPANSEPLGQRLSHAQRQRRQRQSVNLDRPEITSIGRVSGSERSRDDDFSSA
jgi:hypothetical protein